MTMTNSMTSEQSVLWGRVCSFEFDDAQTVNKFSERLARENRWSSSFTRRVIEEYRRFAFLSVAAGHPISPSEVVDQAWHLHLIYTRSYWDEFCGRILGRPLHHFPSVGGDTEQLKLADWYSRTLQSYERLFGEKPPGDVWPSPAEQAKQVHRMVHVDAERNWIVPKLTWSARRDLVACLLLLLAMMTVIGCVPPAVGPLNWQGPEFLKLYYFLLAGATGLGIACRLWLRGAFQPDQPVPEFDPYEVAYLAGGERRVVNAAITSLVARNHLQVSGRTLMQAEPLPAGGHPLEHRLWDAVEDGSKLDKLHSRVASKARSVAERLQDEGLVLTFDQRWIAQLCPPLGLVMLVMLVMFGVAKTAIGLDRRRPVELLLIAIGLTVAIIVVFVLKRPLRTYRGDRQLERLRQQHEKLSSGPDEAIVTEQLESGLESTASPRQHAALGSSAMWPLAFALFGPEVLARGPMDDLKKAFVPHPNNGVASGCATGCGTRSSGCSTGGGTSGCSGGGGDGGGGGGCGGCGGGGGGD